MNNQLVTQNQKSHIQFFDHVRIIAMFCVVLYHSVTAYSTTTPQFPVHDSEPLVFANYVRWIFDVFMMPVFFFVAGFFAVPSVKSKGPGLFILSKIKRLGIPWLALMISLAGFMNFGYIFMSAFKRQEIVSFGDSLIHMLKGLVTFEIADHGDQMHLWFLSLLLFFFVVFTIVYMISKKYFNIFFTGNRSITSSGRSVFNVMLFSGIVLTAGYFIVVILFPGINDWIHLSFLSFEPTKTVSYVVCFCMGIYGYSRNWFAERIGITYINIWAVTGILSLAIFLISGNEILVERAVPEGFSLLQLGVFSIARSFLCISVLFLLVSIAHRYLNFASRFTKKLSENSYHIYIIHLFLVLALQAALRGWAQGPAWLKLVIVFLSAVIFSYLISEYITNRFPKATLVFLVLISISLIFIINPYSYERKFDKSQSEIFEK